MKSVKWIVVALLTLLWSTAAHAQLGPSCPGTYNNSFVTSGANGQTLNIGSQNLIFGGTYPICVVATDPSFGGSPFYQPIDVLGVLPFGTVNAIDYNVGGNGVGYNVPSSNCGLQSSGYRPDTTTFNTNQGAGPPYQLGCNFAGVWYKYTTNITGSGPFSITADVASASSGGSWNVYLDGSLTALGTITTPNTGSYSTFQATGLSTTFSASTGPHTFQFLSNGGDSASVAGDFRSFTVAGGPVAEWVLSSASVSGTTEADATGNGNTATVVNGPLTFGSLGANFNGSNQYLNSPLAVTQSTITVSAWFNAVSFSNGNPRIVANSHTDSDLKGFQMMFAQGGAGGFFDVGNGTAERQAPWSLQLVTGNWYHYVGVYDGATVKAYINGNQLGSAAFVGGAVAAGVGPNVNVGRNPVYNGDYFNGAIYDVRIYNRALSAADVLTLYQSTSPPVAHLSANPSSITTGQSSTLSWSSTNASSCFGTGFSTGGTGPTSGSVSTGALTATTSYSVNCNGALASTTVTVNSGTGVACDQGPNYQGSVPSPAQAAGFTTCALNADFSTNSTDSTGVNYGNKATFLDPCGGTAAWRWYAGRVFQPGNTCANISITTDGGNGQVLLIHQPASQASIGAIDFDWPFPNGSNNPALPFSFYNEITFRTTPNSLGQGVTSTSIINWFEGPGNNYGTWWEADFFEIINVPQWLWGDGGLEWSNVRGCDRSICNGIGTPDSPTLDFTVYHTIATLFTFDGVNQIAKCYYIDGVATSFCTQMGIAFPGDWAVPPASQTPSHTPQHTNQLLMWLGDGKQTNDVDLYIKNIRVFACPSYKTTDCAGTLVR